MKHAIHNNGPLGFTPSAHLIRLLDSSMRQSWVEISACLSGKFHRPEADYMPGYDINSSKGGEHLIFYRRNMFGVAGIVTIPQDLRYVLTLHGNRIPITAKEITIATMEFLEGEWAQMSVAPCQRGSSENTSTGGNQSAWEKPLPISLNFVDSLPTSNGNSMFCFDWERLRFRNATKKNLGFGKPGQNFVIRLQVIATLSTGITVPIAETFSTPIIVRGQNPGQFGTRRGADKATWVDRSPRKKRNIKLSSSTNRQPLGEACVH